MNELLTKITEFGLWCEDIDKKKVKSWQADGNFRVVRPDPISRDFDHFVRWLAEHNNQK